MSDVDVRIHGIEEPLKEAPDYETKIAFDEPIIPGMEVRESVQDFNEHIDPSPDMFHPMSHHNIDIANQEHHNLARHDVTLVEQNVRLSWLASPASQTRYVLENDKDLTDIIPHGWR
ncbi:hypothetical protein LTR23_011177, partial [Exophiala sp. CCFEE 6169]